MVIVNVFVIIFGLILNYIVKRIMLCCLLYKELKTKYNYYFGEAKSAFVIYKCSCFKFMNALYASIYVYVQSR